MIVLRRRGPATAIGDDFTPTADRDHGLRLSWHAFSAPSLLRQVCGKGGARFIAATANGPSALRAMATAVRVNRHAVIVFADAGPR